MENVDLNKTNNSNTASEPILTPEPSIEPPLLHDINPNNKNKVNPKVIPVIVFSIILVAIVGLTAFLIVNRSSDPNIVLSAPSANQIEQFCSSHGLYYALMNEGDPVYMNSKADFSYEEEKLGVNIDSKAVCLAVDSDGSLVPYTDSDITGLSVYFLDKNYTDSAQIKQALASATILDDSPGFLKAIVRDDRGYEYIVFCKNTILSLGTKNIEAGERAIVELGYPDRGRIDDDVVEKKLMSSEELVDTHNREALVKIVDALTSYKNSYGRLPKVDTDTIAIYGYSDREFDAFFRDYIRDQEWFRNTNGESYYTVNATSVADPEKAKYEDITIHYNATCKDGEVVSDNNYEKFAVTIAKAASDGYICVGN